MLRGRPEEKLARPMAVAVYLVDQKATPVYLRPQAKSCKVGRRFLPGSNSVRGPYALQIVKLPQHGMATAKPPDHSCQPAGNQPRGNQTLRVHFHRGSIKASLSHLPAPHPQKQSPYHGTHGVLKVRNQLDRQ